MQNRIAVLLTAVVLCGSAAAQSSAVNHGTQAQGRTRAEVLADLACAQASGEYAAINSDHFDPVALDAARAHAAATPQCQTSDLSGTRGTTQPTATRTRAEVQAELACAQASGEFAALNTDLLDPAQVQAARTRSAYAPDCQNALARTAR